MEQWTRALRLSEPFCDKSRELPDGSYVGLVEAARGSLGHWMAVRDGKIERFQIIAPTTWNFSAARFLRRRRPAGAGAGRH
ncbi:Ni,Fe-hydrogenase I large subunit [Bradyrhizobium sp. i1.7.7]